MDAFVAVAVFAGFAVVDAGDEAASFVAGDFVGADVAFELMALGVGGYDAVEGFVKLGLGLAADGVGDAGGGHEVAFVGGVDEHGAGVCLAGEHGEAWDAGVFFEDAAVAVEPLVAEYGDVVFFDEAFEDALGDAGLEYPHGAVLAVHGRGALAFVSVFGFLLLLPGGVFLVLQIDAVVEVAGESADD